MNSIAGRPRRGAPAKRSFTTEYFLGAVRFRKPTTPRAIGHPPLQVYRELGRLRCHLSRAVFSGEANGEEVLRLDSGSPSWAIIELSWRVRCRGTLRPNDQAFRKSSGSIPACFRMARMCTLGHIAGMVWNCSVLIRLRVKPDFVAASRLAIKLKTARIQFPNDFTIAEPCEPAHFRQQPRQCIRV